MPASLGPVSTHIRKQLGRRLEERRVLVWYDPERAFAALLPRLDLPDCVVVSAGASSLRARREAGEIYRRLDEGTGPERRRRLLIYVPAARGGALEDWQEDPFELFARCGASFGDNEAERLAALAKAALPQRAAELDRLFRDGRPSLDLLNALPAGASYPLAFKALGAESATEAAALALTLPDAGERLAARPGALREIARLDQVELGLPAREGEDWPALRARLARYLLVSELAFDLPGGLPDALDGVAHAEAAARERVLAVCDRLRVPGAARDAYVRLAREVERDLGVERALAGRSALGARDTFPCQEAARLGALVAAAEAGDYAAARLLLVGGDGSPWREDPERNLLWHAAQRCLQFLETASELAGRPLPGGLAALIDAYVDAEGWWRLDRAQRRFEQAGAQCYQDEEVDALIQRCRARYRAALEPLQETFQGAARREGWPPERPPRQTQTFDAHVAPELAERRKVAYVLVDSLRYEMGRDLAAALRGLGEVRIEAAAAVLPPSTPFGMAALLPGADGAYSLVSDGAGLAPAIGETPLPNLAARRAFLAARYGDRAADLTVEEVLSTPTTRLAKRLGAADLIVVRSREIDALGEDPNHFQARRLIGEAIGHLATVAGRLAALGVPKLVFVADHGHLLLPEIPAGDALPVPPGRWQLRKRRSLLGQAQGQTPGVLLFPTPEVGLRGPVEEFAAAAGVKTFGEGGGYFHEGLSLQECLVPVVVVRPQRPAAAAGAAQVDISYRSDRFTSAVVGLKLRARTMLESIVAVRLEAFDGPGPKAKPVGLAGDCDARDPASGEIALPAETDVQVPLVVDPDFHDPQIEVRAIDPLTGLVLGRLALRNARME